VNGKLILYRINLHIVDEDEIETEGQGKMTYKTFKERHLNDVSAFYPSFDAWVLKNTRSKTIEEEEKRRG
jgi:hypothetical protein